jgi:hypothetical protein
LAGTASRFAQSETVKGPTPDFRLRNAKGVLVGYTEVKSPRDDLLDEELEGAADFAIVGHARSDPTFNRIARHVQKSASQFDAVNPQGQLPNILVFVNHADSSGCHDLIETLTGHFHADDGRQYQTVVRIAQRISSAAARIDLFVWIVAKTQKKFYFFNPNSTQVEAICALLALGPKQIEDS